VLPAELQLLPRACRPCSLDGPVASRISDPQRFRSRDGPNLRRQPEKRSHDAGMLVATLAPMQDQVIARVDLPGTVNTDVNLQVHQTRLLITAGPEGTAQLLKHLEGDGHVIYRRDRTTGGFFRSVLLPQGIHVDDIKATMTNGVLVVTAPGKKGRDD
jgi:HSP20 family molecular chaperone IbpA